MNKTLFLQLNKHNVYLLEDQNISLYISVPKKEYFNSTNISIDIKDNYDKINPNTNDEIYVKDEVTRIYNEIDNDNITLVVPLFKNNILSLIREKPTVNLYNYLDKCISYIINNVYKLLVEEQINVNTKIILINNDKFDQFIAWFAERYKNRVETKQYSELLGDFTSVIPVLTTDDIKNIPTDKTQIQVNEATSPGFISYILLTVIGIVLTLIMLYKLL